MLIQGWEARAQTAVVLDREFSGKERCLYKIGVWLHPVCLSCSFAVFLLRFPKIYQASSCISRAARTILNNCSPSSRSRNMNFFSTIRKDSLSGFIPKDLAASMVLFRNQSLSSVHSAAIAPRLVIQNMSTEGHHFPALSKRKIAALINPGKSLLDHRCAPKYPVILRSHTIRATRQHSWISFLIGFESKRQKMAWWRRNNQCCSAGSVVSWVPICSDTWAWTRMSSIIWSISDPSRCLSRSKNPCANCGRCLWQIPWSQRHSDLWMSPRSDGFSL